jgi:hypothetical protein
MLSILAHEACGHTVLVSFSNLASTQGGAIYLRCYLKYEVQSDCRSSILYTDWRTQSGNGINLTVSMWHSGSRTRTPIISESTINALNILLLFYLCNPVQHCCSVIQFAPCLIWEIHLLCDKKFNNKITNLCYSGYC